MPHKFITDCLNELKNNPEALRTGQTFDQALEDVNNKYLNQID